MANTEIKDRHRVSSCIWSCYCLVVCALLSIVSSPLLDRTRFFHDHIYVNWRLSLFTAPLSIVFMVIIVRNSVGIRRVYWWGFMAGCVSLLLSGTTLAWAGMMTGIFQG